MMGKAKNYGIEFTLERFLNKGFYYLTTLSLYDSKYKIGNSVITTRVLMEIMCSISWQEKNLKLEIKVIKPWELMLNLT